MGPGLLLPSYLYQFTLSCPAIWHSIHPIISLSLYQSNWKSPFKQISNLMFFWSMALPPDSDMGCILSFRINVPTGCSAEHSIEEMLYNVGLNMESGAAMSLLRSSTGSWLIKALRSAMMEVVFDLLCHILSHTYFPSVLVSVLLRWTIRLYIDV